MKLLSVLLGTVAFCAVSMATPITLVDDFSTPSATQAVTGVNGTVAVNTGLAGVPTAATNRTTFVKKVGTVGSDPANISALVNSGMLNLSEDTGVNGIGGVFYQLTGAPSDMTALNAYFSIDWMATDITGGNLTFFVTSSLSNGATLATEIINGSAGTSWYTQPTNISPVHTYSATLAQILSNGTANVAALTGFGFYYQTTINKVDTSFDNFAVATPEPGTYALMGAGLAALAFLRRRK